MTKFEDNISPYLSFVEGSAPSSPAATNFKLYYDSSDHLLKWKNSAGTVAVVPRELDYVEFTTTVSPTSTGSTDGTTDLVVAGTSQAYTAIPILIEFECSDAQADPAVGRFMQIWLFDGTAQIGYWLIMAGTADGSVRSPLHVSRRLTPSAATHQYRIKASVSAGTGALRSGAGGNGASMPGFIRITTA